MPLLVNISLRLKLKLRVLVVKALTYQMEGGSTSIPSRSMGLSCQRGSPEESHATDTVRSCRRTLQPEDHRRIWSNIPLFSWRTRSLEIKCCLALDKGCVNLQCRELS